MYVVVVFPFWLAVSAFQPSSEENIITEGKESSNNVGVSKH